MTTQIHFNRVDARTGQQDSESWTETDGSFWRDYASSAEAGWGSRCWAKQPFRRSPYFPPQGVATDASGGSVDPALSVLVPTGITLGLALSRPWYQYMNRNQVAGRRSGAPSVTLAIDVRTPPNSALKQLSIKRMSTHKSDSV